MLRAARNCCSKRVSVRNLVSVPPAYNEEFLHFPKGSEQRTKLDEAVSKWRAQMPHQIPAVINGERIYENPGQREIPYQKQTTLATYTRASPDLMKRAVDTLNKDWAHMPFDQKAAIMVKAADLLTSKYRYDILATTMLGQGKTAWQAEIDAGVELPDFWRFNVQFAQQIMQQQPICTNGVWNSCTYRGLEGFVLAISPFNFTAIGGNLPTSPAIMGNVCVWKPSSAAILSNYLMYQILEEAGMPAGVINFIPSDTGADIENNLLKHPDMGGLHFTGSSKTFNHLWKVIGNNLDTYRSYPRIVGETGGKNFHLLLPTADWETAVNQTIRGAFEYSGQKCSACSRAFVPKSMWEGGFRDKLCSITNELTWGNAEEWGTFTSCVIDETSFKKVTGYIEAAKQDPSCTIVAGGNYSDADGWMVQPTVVLTTDLNCKLLNEEIFGPVVTVYVYEDNNWEQMVRDVDNGGGSYALTGAIFARDRNIINQATKLLHNNAGNFYINDKCTGSIVAQQPFGGARKSGTNDKAGNYTNLLRWTSVRSTKESMLPLTDYRYPSLEK